MGVPSASPALLIMAPLCHPLELTTRSRTAAVRRHRSVHEEDRSVRPRHRVAASPQRAPEIATSCNEPIKDRWVGGRVVAAQEYPGLKHLEIEHIIY